MFSEEREFLNQAVGQTEMPNLSTINVPDRFQSIQLQDKPRLTIKKGMTVLNPVQPPKRDGSLSPTDSADKVSVGGSNFSVSGHGGGYSSSVMSHGIPTDSESSRFSTVQQYKYNKTPAPN